MFDRISNSFALARSSWEVLRTEKQLIVFPMLSGLACLLIFASFAAPFIIQPQLLDFLEQDNPNQGTPLWVYAATFIFYFCNYFAIVFFNSALVSCAIIRFNGGSPTVSDGLGAAMSRLPQIAAWALVSATVGLLLRIIENAHEKGGEFIAAIVGTAWTVVTFFVVPVLVVEQVGPFAAIQRSMQILKKTWGEALVGHWGVGFFVFLMSLPGIILMIAGVYMLASKMVALGIAVAIFGFILLLIASAAGSALNGIFLGALYQYASTGQTPSAFDSSVLSGAFGPKSSS